MAIHVIQIKVSKERLATLTRDQRSLMILAGHSMNVVTTWVKMVAFSANHESDNDVERTVQSGQTHVLLRALYGSLVEAYEWIRRSESQALIGQFYLPAMPEKSQRSYSELKRQFGRSGVLHQIRNNFSNHYPNSSTLEKAFESAPSDDDWSWYMSPALSNSSWWACEAVITRGVLNQTGKGTEVDALADIIRHAMITADLMVDTVQGLLNAMFELHFSDLQNPELVLTVNGAPRSDKFFIPFFSEGSFSPRPIEGRNPIA